jgi:aconitate hydratase
VIGDNDKIEIGGIKAALEKGADLSLTDATSGKTATLKYSLSMRQRDILLAGGMLNYTRSRVK